MVFNHIKGHDCFFSRGISAKTRVPDWIHFNFDPQNDVQCDKTYVFFQYALSTLGFMIFMISAAATSAGRCTVFCFHFFLPGTFQQWPYSQL